MPIKGALWRKVHEKKDNKNNVKQEEFDSKKQVKEYKRKCNQCGKVWHSLENREKQIQQNSGWDACIGCNTCNPGAQLQARRNIEAGESELDKLRKCPNCGSGDYTEEVIIYEKNK
jgi:ribosomal protein S27AE